MNKSALLLSSALAFGSANADNTKPPILEGNVGKEVVTVYSTANKVDKFNNLVSDTTLNIAQVVGEKKSGILYSEWCAENPDACKRVGEIHAEREVNQKRELAEKSSNVDFIVKGKTFGLGIDTEHAYGEVTLNPDGKEVGVGVAYKDESGVVVGGSVAGKENVGLQTGVGAGYVKSFNKSSIGVAAKYTDFNAESIYADSNSINARIMGTYEIAQNLYADASIGYKTFSADGYDRKNTAEGSLGLSYVDESFTVRLAGVVNDVDSKVMATLSIPFGGKNVTNAFAVGQSNVAKFIANSSFDNSIVKVKKVPVVNNVPEVLPAQTLSITTSGPAITSGANTDNVTATNGPGSSVFFNLTINSPYTLSSNSVEFTPNLSTETQTVNILHNGNIVGTRTLTVNWF
ncbi:MAG: hypothetical protein PHH98_00745 [Candidatus Gracilibacteria bacterium]|nr:hypothetical protein [Candidatus Gracilibacteria bacterium]